MKINCDVIVVYLINVYVLMLFSEDFVNDVFYDIFNVVLSRILFDDYVVLFGDFNVRVGVNYVVWLDFMVLER